MTPSIAMLLFQNLYAISSHLFIYFTHANAKLNSKTTYSFYFNLQIIILFFFLTFLACLILQRTWNYPNPLLIIFLSLLTPTLLTKSISKIMSTPHHQLLTHPPTITTLPSLSIIRFFFSTKIFKLFSFINS